MLYTRFPYSSRCWKQAIRLGYGTPSCCPRITSLWSHTATEACQKVAQNGPEEKIEDELKMSEDEYIPVSQTVYATPEDIQHMIKAALESHDEAKIQRLIDDTVNRHVHYIFKNAHEKAATRYQHWAISYVLASCDQSSIPWRGRRPNQQQCWKVGRVQRLHETRNTPTHSFINNQGTCQLPSEAT